MVLCLVETEMSSTLENEDLDNVPLVRMQDVQPARDRICPIFSNDTKNESVEAYIVDHIEYDNECVVDDDDSNIGSMVSIHSEEVVEYEEGSNELVDPDGDEIHAEANTVHDNNIKPKITLKPQPDSWPTLEILPGGVIKYSDRYDNDLHSNSDNESESGEMMYACAKCSQSFKYLFCLVKHVRWHEKQAVKPAKGPDLTTLKNETGKILRNYICVQSKKRAVIGKTMKIKRQRATRRRKP